MSYVVLARRLRPSRFDDLIGQETAAQTLRNAVLTDRVAHAFLFTGSRGVGKTSAARILTRALNCLNPDNGDPCNTCENCIEITQNASPDVHEIDAASNRGIDNIRELRENVNYVPARCRYKVYIIDEAHMLTLESFNALLKTLEEPPSYVKFIFATTDPHKIPQTIISRCQRYDFLRIPINTMADFLEKVVRNEELELSRKAIEMIARNSVGGMRDALTAIDQILSFTGTSASDQKVAQILGILDSDSRFAFTEALLKKNDGEAIRHFNELLTHGHDANDILSDLLQTIKTTALVRTLGTKPALFQDISSDDLEVFANLSKAISADELQQIFRILLELEEQMKRSSHTKICFEMAILQIASIEPLVGLQEIINEIQNIRGGESPVEKNSEKSASETVDEAGTTFSREKTFASNPHQTESVNSGNKKIPAGAAVIKNILQSATKVALVESPKTLSETVAIPETPVIPVKITEKSCYTQENGKNTYVAETAVYPEKTEETEKVLHATSIETALDTAPEPSTEPFTKPSPEPSLETQTDDLKITDNEKGAVDPEVGQNADQPQKEWLDFSAEVQKRSSKLASFVRNAVPQSLSGTQLKLVFKSGNYPSMFTEQNRSLLEEIATDCCGHAVHVSCEILPTVTAKLTIVEHDQIVLEKKKEIKRKNAKEFPLVKEILEVFTNSKITAIEFSKA